MPRDEIEAARRKMDTRTFRQEYEASFENYAGVVYYCFARRASHTDAVIRTGEVLHVGMDFNVGKMAAVTFVVRDGLPFAVDETMKALDTPAMIEKLQDKYPGFSIVVYPDASGENRKTSKASESDVSLLRKAGFTVRVNAANPAVRDRENSVNAMLHNTVGVRRLLINTDRCRLFTQSLERQIYSDDCAPDKKAEYDHANNAGGYFIVSRYPIQSRVATQSVMR